jgi:ubiquinone/menaquinone biosynthesis C-methylase UbiE
MVSVEKAILYENYRFPYAREAVDDLLTHIGHVQVVADIGAGTGQLARLFAEKSAKVCVVEPDTAMRGVASSSLTRFATVEVRAGYAEQTTLPENSIDLIVIGNAFHRFKPEACVEFRRILKRTGWIALFAYRFLNEAYAEMLSSRMATLKELMSRREKSTHRTSLQDLFGGNLIRTLCHRQSLTEDWNAFFGAACAAIEAPERHEPDFAQFEVLHREVFNAFAVNGKIQIDYETDVSFGQPPKPVA